MDTTVGTFNGPETARGARPCTRAFEHDLGPRGTREVRHDGRGQSYLPILASQAGEMTDQELTKARRRIEGRR